MRDDRSTDEVPLTQRRNPGWLRSMRELVGVAVKDSQRYRAALASPDREYLALCNRNERLEKAPDGSGFRCDWQWTSELHAPKHVPSWGVRLIRRALAEHPIVRSDTLIEHSGSPEVSFLIGHRGTERMPQLLATLETIAGQSGAPVECIVVEADDRAHVLDQLPSWVRHVHTPPPDPTMPYCRAWTFNVAARHARGRILILHDNDILVPHDYAREAVRRLSQGFQVANLKRFIFYLARAHSESVLRRTSAPEDSPPETIVQNAEAGGSLVVTREAYERVGGMDEGFIGWGGEDNEFWERAQTLPVWPYGYLPMVHLWHRAQPGKGAACNPATQRHRDLAKMPVSARINRLKTMRQGNAAGPAGWFSMPSSAARHDSVG